MNTRSIHVLTCAIAAATFPSAWATDAVALADSLRINDPVNGFVKIGRRTIAIPTGEWRLVSKIEKNSSSDGSSQMPRIVTLYFQEVIDGRLNRGLEVAATANSGQFNWLDEPCKNKNDSYWIDDRKRGMSDQFCTRVGYLSGVVDGARGEAFERWAREIKEKGIGYSPEMPYVSVVRYTSYDYIRMSINFDPNISGLMPSQNPARNFNDWQGQAVSNRPRHKQFYDALVNWAPKFALGVQRAFDEDKYLSPSDFGTPALPNKP